MWGKVDKFLLIGLMFFSLRIAFFQQFLLNFRINDLFVGIFEDGFQRFLFFLIFLGFFFQKCLDIFVFFQTFLDGFDGR